MNTNHVAEILALPVQERIRLVELIWDSVAAMPQADVSPELQAELESRLQAFAADPESGFSWDEVKAHVRDGTWRST